MSAYLCSEATLTALADYAVAHCLHALPRAMWESDIGGRAYGSADGQRRVRSRVQRRVRSRVQQMLLAENLASLHARYGSRAAEDVQIADAYDLDVRTLASPPPPIVMIKLCDHYAYQACEHAGWTGSDAKRLIEAIAAHAVRELPGYAEAPWGLP